MTPSPCIRVCRIERGLCVGCGRTLEEVAGWSRMSDEEKAAVVQAARWRMKGDDDD